MKLETNRYAELLTPATNYAVVQLPERKFPGVVFQGDSLYCLIQNLASMSELLAQKRLEDLAIQLEGLREDLSEILNRYEAVCSQKAIGLPYIKNTESE